VLRKVILTAIIALVAVGAVQASGGKELRISGPVVRASAHSLSVENLVGDAVLTCAVPAKLADRAAALELGDRIRMVCVRFRGRKALLVKIQRLGEKPARTRENEKKADDRKTDEKKADEKKADEKKADKQEAAGEVRLYGRIVELSRAAVTVQGEAGSLTCVPPAALLEKVAARFAVGDSVKMMCRGSELSYLEKV